MELGILVLRATAALAAALTIASWYPNGSARFDTSSWPWASSRQVLALPLSGLMPAWEMTPPAAVERPAVEPQAGSAGPVAVATVASPATPPPPDAGA